MGRRIIRDHEVCAELNLYFAKHAWQNRCTPFRRC